jgi:hypothetical protein
MPVNVQRVDELAAAVADVYREGETALLRTVTDRLDAGHDGPTEWQASRLAQLGALRTAASRIVTAMTFTGNREVRAAVAAGYRAGRADGVAELAEQLVGPHAAHAARVTGAAARRGALAVHALADAAVAELRPIHAAILPEVERAYRQAIAGAAARRLTGATSTREAAQAAWAALNRDGITGYTDTSGRRWRLHTWVEMATRTAVGRAAVHGQVDELTAGGIRLVSVDDLPGECWRCRPYEHRVLALWGATGVQHVPHARTGELVPVDVVATLDEAMLAGFMHPNCRHTIRAYYPGVSMLIKRGRTADPEGEAAIERQRAIERHLRYWREQEVAALTPAGRQAAAARVASWDAEITAHVAAHGLTRKRYREHIGAGHVPPPGRVDDVAALLGIPAPEQLEIAA